jgi:acyl-homoserine-lactone acylase
MTSRFTSFLLCTGLFLLVNSSLRSQDFPAINTQNVTIIRDSLGMPHIFGHTDAEAAYGLAYANCEDAFQHMQEQLLLSKQLQGRVKGVDGAKADFFAHFIAAREIVDYRFEDDLTPEYKRYLDGYVQGVNAYAFKHPEEVLNDREFPITSKDILTAYMVALSYLSGAAGDLPKAMDGTAGDPPKPWGSNAFAMNAPMTKDGKTYLCTNPHFMMDGPFSFYEAHIASDEGLNFTGALFHGGTSIFMGNNEHLGWGMTYNYFDRSDIYELKMEGHGSKYYEYDGKWYKLRKRPLWLHVNLGKKPNSFVLPVHKMTYMSLIGPTVKSKNGKYYALRFPANHSISVSQQLYYMNKAQNFEQWKAAVNRQALTFFNLVYADQSGNIYYNSYGAVPDRNKTYDSYQPMPGNTSDAVWNKLIPVDSLPHVLNPPCGYVFNTNNSPFHATCKGSNDDPSRLPPYVDERPGDNNRAERLVEMIEAHPGKFSFEDFKALKFDCHFPKQSVFLSSIHTLFELDPAKYPNIAPLIERVKRWNKSGEPENTEATIIALCLDNLIRGHNLDDAQFVSGLNLPESDYVKAYEYAKAYLDKYYKGNYDVPMGDIHRLRRGKVDMPAIGFPDMLCVSYPKQQADGKFTPDFGDTFVQFVVFGKNGVECMESLLPFGASCKDNSPHLTDQMGPFTQHRPKTLYLNQEQCRQHAERIYHPGE